MYGTSNPLSGSIGGVEEWRQQRRQRGPPSTSAGAPTTLHRTGKAQDDGDAITLAQGSTTLS